MVRVVLLHQEELTDGHGTKGQHRGAEFPQGLALQHHAPQVDSVPGFRTCRPYPTHQLTWHAKTLHDLALQ